MLSRHRLRHLGRWCLPLALWAVVMLLQDRLIVPRCVTEPDWCQPESLAPWDRWSVNQDHPLAKAVDDGLQIGVTLTAVGLPLLGHAGAGPLALRAVAADWGVLLEAGLWNVAATELSQLLVQRPRPALFGSPAKPPERRSQYTSFYSGHTSYVAAMGAASVMLARRYNWSLGGRRVLVAAAVLATLLAGVLRILQSKHFLLDVIAGGLAGALVAYWVARKRSGP